MTQAGSMVPHVHSGTSQTTMAGLQAASSSAACADSSSASRRPGVNGQVLREHFHLPLHTVAHKFGMCTTAFKKMCRRLGIAKWPHRQLRGIDKKIAALKAEVTYASSGDRQRFLSGLSSLEEEKSRLANGILGGQGPHEQTSPGGDESNCLGDSSHDAMEEDDSSTPPPSTRRRPPAAASDNSDEESVEDEDTHLPSGPARSSEQAPSSTGGGMAITEKELRQHFHLPLHTAAQKFGICTTAFKKMCRRLGIAKWPHRQLRGIDKKIAALKAELNYAADDRDVYCRSLQALEDEKIRLSLMGRGNSSPLQAVQNESTAKTCSPTKNAHVESPAASRDDDHSCHDGLSALDLLAAVAGVKEERDREEEARRQRMEAAEAPQRASSQSGSASGSDDRCAHFDTPPLEPMSPLSLQESSTKICMSPMLKAFSAPMTPMASSTPLIGFSWTGERCQ